MAKLKDMLGTTTSDLDNGGKAEGLHRTISNFEAKPSLPDSSTALSSSESPLGFSLKNIIASVIILGALTALAYYYFNRPQRARPENKFTPIKRTKDDLLKTPSAPKQIFEPAHSKQSFTHGRSTLKARNISGLGRTAIIETPSINNQLKTPALHDKSQEKSVSAQRGRSSSPSKKLKFKNNLLATPHTNPDMYLTQNHQTNVEKYSTSGKLNSSNKSDSSGIYL